MSKVNPADIQGFVLRGYRFPLARFLFLEILQPNGREFVSGLTFHITSGDLWHDKPLSTVNIAFTYQGLVNLMLPPLTLLSFPVEFVQGMKQRGDLLHDHGRNSPEHWDSMWKGEQVHGWLGVYAQTSDELEKRCGDMEELMQMTGGAAVIGSQDAGALWIDGLYTSKEHFGYSDGFGNPDYLGIVRDAQPGQGKLGIFKKGWNPLATGELLLGHPDEAGELPVAPIPNLLAENGTFMVYRKLHQNVATFRNYLDEQGKLYSGGREKLASKFVGRWRDGTPVELSPDHPDPALVGDANRNTNFTYGDDPTGLRCPLGAHVRRANPRDSFGFNGTLANRHRIARRGIPYGAYTPEEQQARDDDEHGIIFIALNASISRQFEFVSQNWMEYGNDAHQGNDQDVIAGNHDGGTFMVQGTEAPSNPPFLCVGLPNFVELRGGDYFFVPSITALRMIATGRMDPR